MLNTRLYRKSSLALGVAFALYGNAGFAQESATQLEEIVVTGSFIRGMAEQAALPVDVVTAEDLQKQGSPTMVELMKALPSSQGIFGDSNQFTAGQSTGSANVNLRGLGTFRTLVLLNGRRVAPNPAVGAGVDINLLPTAAIERIEVLKDGAAATYGSDAIAGVVNFITKRNFDGLLLDGTYSYIDGSDGDYGINAAFGWQNDRTDILVTAGYRHRSELSAQERDWALRSYEENPQGGWSGLSNPGAFAAGAGFATRIVDPQCGNMGTVPTATVGGVSGVPVALSAASGCVWQYLAFDNLIEDEDHYQVFGQLNQKLGDSMNLHFEALYAAHEVEAENSSPSYGPNQGPAINVGAAGTPVASGNGGAPSYFVPIGNPGFTGLLSQLTPAQQTAITTSGGVVASGLLWRPLGVGGNPLTNGGKEDQRNFSMYRFSVGLDGDIGDALHWDAAVTYGETKADIATPDMLVARLDRALRGFGGANCTGATPGANGCLWFNPFSTSISQNAVTKQQSSVGASAPNSLEVVDWLFEDYAYILKQSVLSIDAGLTGELAWSLPGGDIGWAAGVQYRENGYLRDANDFSDPAVMPCPQSPINPAATCSIVSGAFSFFGPLAYYDLTQEVISAYAELSLPIIDSLDAQLAVRYEDYGNGIGDTTNPKLAIHWKALDELSFRGSVGTTFRAPPQTQTVPGLGATASIFTAQAGGYKPYDTYGNPNLKAEEALAFNVGFIVKVGGFSGSLDYWQFNFADVIANESGTDMVRAVFDSTFDPTTFASRCTNPAYAGLIARMTFSGTGCGNPAAANPNQPVVGNLVRTQVKAYNGSDIDVSGIDLNLRYAFDQVLSGNVTVGADGTYNLEYSQEAIVVEGIELQPTQDYAGTRGTAGSQPRWKASVFAEYSMGGHNIRWTSRYISSMEDTRVGQSLTTFAGIKPGDPGSTVDSFLTHDLNYRVLLPAEMTLNASITNVFDEDPPFARLDLSYDPFTGSPVGRVIKLGFSKRF